MYIKRNNPLQLVTSPLHWVCVQSSAELTLLATFRVSYLQSALGSLQAAPTKT